MTPTLVEQLAGFAADTASADLPAEVVHECKRIMLDSLACAIAAHDHPKGRIGVRYADLHGIGGPLGSARIIGRHGPVSVFGAAFANGELINALDWDAVLPPGHVTPYVLPGALAIAEAGHASGRALLAALAVSHEMSYRIGKAMDYLRDIKDGVLAPPKVYGYSSTIFGASAAIAMLRGQPASVIADALGIAGSTAPVNSHWTWVQHAPSTTIKYLMAGTLVQSALSAAFMGEMGHRGDLRMLDDADVGFARIIGTTRWEPGAIATDLGRRWLFPAEQSYKPYPHCRILHALLDCMTEVLAQHDIRPDEIEGIEALVEGFVMQPIWQVRDIRDVTDAQFSIAHGLALGAHRIRPGKAWQDPAVVFARSVLDLMPKVTFKVHPEYVSLLSGHAASRPAHVEIRARGRTFVAQKRYPHGSPSPDPATTMTDAELDAKFRHAAEGVIDDRAAADVVRCVMHLDDLQDVARLMDLLTPSDAA